MATFSKQLLSGSTNGKQIKISQTVSAGTLIHSALAGTSALDEIWLYAINTHTSDVTLTLEWGEATAPDGNIIVTIPMQSGYKQIAPGLLLQNSLVVRAFASVANKICINGFVNRIS